MNGTPRDGSSKPVWRARCLCSEAERPVNTFNPGCLISSWASKMLKKPMVAEVLACGPRILASLRS